MIKQKPKIKINLVPGARIQVIDRDTYRRTTNEIRKFVATVLKEYRDFWLVRNEKGGYKECISKRLIETGHIKIKVEG